MHPAASECGQLASYLLILLWTLGVSWLAEIMEENVFCSIQQVSGVVSCLCKLSESHLLDIIVIVLYHVVSILSLPKHSIELYLNLVQSSIITRMGRVLLCIFKSRIISGPNSQSEGGRGPGPCSLISGDV